MCHLLSMLMLSMVCCSNPCMRSMTKIAISHNEEPRLRRLVKDSCPGVSITNRPGSFTSKGWEACMDLVCASRVSLLNWVAPICWVIPPASPSCTLVCRILSRSLVLPVWVSECVRVWVRGGVGESG